MTIPSPSSVNQIRYPAIFIRAVVRVLQNEGGYVKLSADPGGETSFGISHRDYPTLDIRNLTREAAIGIYFRDFWSVGRYPDLPDPVALKLFDLSINMGPAHAARCLQRALRACGNQITEDGVVGDETVRAAIRADPGSLLGAFRSEAAGYYRSTAELSPREAGFLEGWLTRAYQ
jgi:lysozyme family protein